MELGKGSTLRYGGLGHESQCISRISSPQPCLSPYDYLHFISNNHQVQFVRIGFPLSTFTSDESIIMHSNQRIPHGPHKGLRMEESECGLKRMDHLHLRMVGIFGRNETI